MQAPTFLRVDATFKENGEIVPITFYWTDGTPYFVTVIDVRPGHSLKHGGAGIRYTVRIRGKEHEHVRVLFLVENRWFVEEKDPA